MNYQNETIAGLADRSRRAYLELLGASVQDRNKALAEMAKGLWDDRESVAAANKKDLEEAHLLVAEGGLTQAALARLVLDEEKLARLVDGLGQVAALPDPAGRVLWSMKLDDGLVLRRVSCPLGVIGVVFESRPEVVVQVSSLLLKAGNAGILKGGKEASRTNAVLMEILRAALERSGSVPVDALQLVSTREEVAALLDCDESIDLLIPRGSNELVRHIKENTKIPVLGHADGICHVYVHENADPEKALRVVLDSKTDYPAVCNAVETLLVDEAVAPELAPRLVQSLRERSVEVRGCAATKALIEDVVSAGEDDWSNEYLDLVVNLKIVRDLKEAVDHINRYGSHHTDAIVTENEEAATHFTKYVDSAGVFVNASTRFSDGYRYGFGAEIGISTNKIHARGPVGLEGIVTYKYELRGDGHIVSEYSSKKKTFKHELL